MGVGGISIWQLLIILLIIVLLFGTKKLRNIGADLGSAIKNFRSSMKEGEEEAQQDTADKPKITSKDETGRVIDAEVTSRENHKA